MRRCLERDVKRRLPDIGVARLEIDEALATPAGDPAANIASPSTVALFAWRSMLPFAAGAALTALVMWGAAARRSAESAEPVSPMVRFAVTLPADAQIALSFNDRDLALSPDGTRVVYTAGSRAQLMVRAFDRLDPLPLAGVTNARAPFVSADGRWIGFFDRLDEGLTTGPILAGVLKRIPIDGGPSAVIASISGGSRGASWGPDDSIVFATKRSGNWTSAHRRARWRTRGVDAAGRKQGRKGPSLSLAVAGRPCGRVHHHRRECRTPCRGSRFWAPRMEVVLRSGSQAAYVDTGHLVYEDGGALWAVRFDSKNLWWWAIRCPCSSTSAGRRDR